MPTHTTSTDRATMMAWQRDQIRALDLGVLDPADAAALDAAAPGWHSVAVRLTLGLEDDDDTVGMLAEAHRCLDAGILSEDEAADLDEVMPEWSDEATRAWVSDWWSGV